MWAALGLAALKLAAADQAQPDTPRGGGGGVARSGAFSFGNVSEQTTTVQNTTNAINGLQLDFTPTLGTTIGGGVIAPNNPSSLSATQDPSNVQSIPTTTTTPGGLGSLPPGLFGGGAPPGTYDVGTLTGTPATGIKANLSSNNLLLLGGLLLLLVLALSSGHHKGRR